MTLLITQFALLSLLVLLAGTLLTQSADRIAEASGMGRSFAGFVLLAAATSLPELTIDSSAALLKAADLAIGDMLGSCLFNLLILGVIDLAHRRTVHILSPISAAHALSAATSIVLTCIVLLGILSPVRVGILGIGIGSFAVTAAYVLSVRLIYFDQRAARMMVEQEQSSAPSDGPTLRTSAMWFGSATLAILILAPLLARVGNSLAEQSGLGGTFVGTTFVALTTSFPEIVTTLVAVRIGAFELAVGNIFGSNCFNVAILPVVDAFYQPVPVLSVVDPAHAITAASVIMITGVAMMGLLYRVEKKLWLVEPDALLVVLLVLGTLMLIYHVGVSHEVPTGEEHQLEQVFHRRMESIMSSTV